jgi:hypothetical protein
MIKWSGSVPDKPEYAVEIPSGYFATLNTTFFATINQIKQSIANSSRLETD